LIEVFDLILITHDAGYAGRIPVRRIFPETLIDLQLHERGIY
jgi:hypothetical protein